MRIGILTLPFNNNYGGYLQAYALLTFLKEQGYNVELIYRKHNRRNWKFRIKYVIVNIIKLLIGKEHGTFMPNQEEELRSKGRNIMPFVDKYIYPKTKPFYSTRDLTRGCAGQYDAIIAGSDQLWRPDYVPNIEDFYLSFEADDNVKKLAYAASFGTDMPIYSDEERRICGEAISKFVGVSVREDSGIDIIKRFGWKTQSDPIVVLDPTMLLTKEHYNTLLSETLSQSSGKVFCYVLDPSSEAKSIVEEVCNQTNLEPYHIIDSEKWKRNDYYMPSIEEWLVGIRDAEFVVTDSFHGTVFSIIFNKPFIVYANKTRGMVRFQSLLNTLGLLSRMISTPLEVSNILYKPIDWEMVAEVVEKERMISKEFLHSSLAG